MATIQERLASLETARQYDEERFSRTADMLEQQQQANAQTAQHIAAMAATHHTPETCPNTCKVNRMWGVHLVAAGLIAVVIALGLMTKIGTALWSWFWRF